MKCWTTLQEVRYTLLVLLALVYLPQTFGNTELAVAGPPGTLTMVLHIVAASGLCFMPETTT
jgi:hypothetical protein